MAHGARNKSGIIGKAGRRNRGLLLTGVQELAGGSKKRNRRRERQSRKVENKSVG